MFHSKKEKTKLANTQKRCRYSSYTAQKTKGTYAKVSAKICAKQMERLDFFYAQFYSMVIMFDC